MYRRKYNLQSNEKKYAIQRIVAAVDIVAQEEVIVKGGLPTDFEQLQQIKELSMHCAQSGYIQANCSRGGSNRINASRVKFFCLTIAHYNDRSFDWFHVLLALENLLSHIA